MNIDLPRLATTSKHWLWLTGTTALILCREHPCASVDPDRLRHVVTRDGALDLSAYRWMGIADHDPLPDLDAPGTKGALIALVRAAWNIPYLHLTRWQAGSETLWVVADEDAEPLWDGLTGKKFFAGLTEAEALISALIAAP